MLKGNNLGETARGTWKGQHNSTQARMHRSPGDLNASLTRLRKAQTAGVTEVPQEGIQAPEPPD